MKKLFAVWLILTSGIAYAGVGYPITLKSYHGRERSIQIGITVSPDVVGIRHKVYPGAKVSMGTTVGASVCFNISKVIGIETGLQYSRRGYRFPWSDASSGPVGPVIPGLMAKVYYRYDCLSIPLRVNVSIGKKKVRFVGSTGFMADVFIQQKRSIYFKLNDGPETRSDIYRKTDFSKSYSFKDALNISYLVAAGIDYQINGRMDIRAQPIFRCKPAK